MHAFLSFLAGLMVVLPCCIARAQEPFLTQPQWQALRDEASGAAAYENLRVLATLHRVPSMPEFDQAAEFVLGRARAYGLEDAHAEQYAIDGKVRYGLMLSHLAWQVEEASLWELAPDAMPLGDWATNPIRLADYSHSADVRAPLVDVGAGTEQTDYLGKDVRGKIVLADGVLSTVQRLAVVEHGASGVVSAMPNQTTAWSGLDTTIVRWGHLDPRLTTGFAFMVSRGTATALRAQLAAGHTVLLKAHVKASMQPGHWTVITGTIPGTDPHAGEVVYSCHLDHQRPGANDNASGCVSTLESARVLSTLIHSGKLARPARTIRFIWGPEVEGTMAFLSQHPDIRQELRADVHMDMVGGDPFKDKSILHVTETPWSLPTFVTDVGDLFAETLRADASMYGVDGSGADAAVLETRNGGSGTRNEFLVDETSYAEGSDHDDYDSSTIAVPSLYLRDWPDIYIHTDHDTLEQIDPTKLRRAVLLGAAAGYTYASLGQQRAEPLLSFFAARSEARLAAGFERAQKLADDRSLQAGDAWYEARNVMVHALAREQAELEAFATYTQSRPSGLASFHRALQAQAETLEGMLATLAAARGATGAVPLAPWRAESDAALVPARVGAFGPLTYQNDDVLLDRLGPERMRNITLLGGRSSRLVRVQDKGALYAYEIVNFVNGQRSLGQIRDAVAAEFGPIPLAAVSDYLKACQEAGVITFR